MLNQNFTFKKLIHFINISFRKWYRFQPYCQNYHQVLKVRIGCNFICTIICTGMCNVNNHSDASPIHVCIAQNPLTCSRVGVCIVSIHSVTLTCWFVYYAYHSGTFTCSYVYYVQWQWHTHLLVCVLCITTVAHSPVGMYTMYNGSGILTCWCVYYA